MEHIDLTLHTLTPLFMAGQNGTTIELRPPSLKGLLRFWWRAWYWGHTPDATLDNLHNAEGAIFGTSAGDGRKSRFSIRIKPHTIKGSREKFPPRTIQVTTSRRPGRPFPVNILEYLAYGTYDFKKGFSRDYVPVGQEISVRLSSPDDDTTRAMLTAFYLLAVFGGMGAKAHNGFGNFSVANPDVFKQFGLELPYPFPDSQFLQKELLLNATLPPYSAFSAYKTEQNGQGMKILKLKDSSSTWDDCLAKLGIAYRDARNTIEHKHDYDKRQYIGAPIVVFNEGQQSFSDRHTKPYFLRVVQRADRQFDGYILYLPSEYSTKVPQSKSSLSPQQHTKKFLQYCGEFNQKLVNAGMEVYYE